MTKVLIVEDDLSYMRLLQDAIEREGYKVLSATNGKEGLALANKKHPDLILLDIRMPLMDGMTMLEQLRSNSYGQKAKVIMLTNLEPDALTIKRVLKDQPTYYLIKSDIKRSELIQTIKELLEDSKAVSKIPLLDAA